MRRITGYQMVAPDRPLERVSFPFPELPEDRALVEVAGCGVCHTDVSFWHHGVPTRHGPPLILGHEISGTVVEGPSPLKGKPVIVPAVLPCGECDLCRSGRSNICSNQVMPGNDFHGGFATHVVVPARFLCPVPEEILAKHSLADVAVVSDAVSTPYQVVIKSGLRPGDLAVVIGVGGVGVYAAQLARSMGGKVVAVDISQERLDRLKKIGITATVNNRDLDVREVKKRVKVLAEQMGAPGHDWKIYEVSGTKNGQELAFALTGVAGTLSIVGFTLDKVEIRLSNLMAFDAAAIGTWGCKPELYPEVLDLVAQEKVIIGPFTEPYPLSEINTIFQRLVTPPEDPRDRIVKRPVLVPDTGEKTERG
ncbi:MAG: 6-hydroxycyclohex-1-ene-1-carbonyl-CoA dehydrogenase [Fidelibacterota bacterium]